MKKTTIYIVVGLLCPKSLLRQSCKPLYIALSMLCLFSAAKAQEIPPLNIGDSIPYNLRNMPLQVVNHPQGKKFITLNDYRGKLIILDFWATWCSSCIANFPKMEALEKEFGDKIQIIAVTYEDRKKIADFFASKTVKKYEITSVVSDTILKKIFPHRGIPHCVWVNTGGEVAAITGADEVTSSNINAILAGHGKKLISKIDIDPQKPLFLSDNFPGNLELSHYSILSKGHYAGLPSGTRFRTSNNITNGRSVTNSVMLQIYEDAISPLFSALNDSYSTKRLLMEVKDKAKITMTRNENGYWDVGNEYNYDLIVPMSKADSLYEYMLEDLNRYTNYFGKIEKRLTKCLVLVRTSAIDKIKTRGGNLENSIPAKPSKLINGPISYLVMRLNGEATIKLPIVDETHYIDNVDIRLSGDLELQALRKELKQYDLDLAEAERYLNIFVLRDKSSLSE